MITSAELQLVRNAVGGAVLPGIDAPAGNPYSLGSLHSYTALSSGSYLYVPSENAIVITKAGTVVSGINFGNLSLMISANNVTVKDCTFTDTTGGEAIYQWPQASGATVENCTFIGSLTAPGCGGCVVQSNTNIAIENNKFLNVQNDGIHIEQGTVSGNYMQYGGGGDTGDHADAIYVGTTTGPVSITNNFVDWTNNPGAASLLNNAVRITTELGNTSNVTVSGNYLIGGTWTVDAGNEGGGTFSNISVKNNYIGFGEYGPFYPGKQAAVTGSGNEIIDFTNPTYSTSAWAAYEMAGIPTPSLAVSTGNAISPASSAVPATLYGSGFKIHMYGDNGETNFVGGSGVQYMSAGRGANIFTDLTISDSTPWGYDEISNFDSAKDVIDLSHIDANLTAAGLQSFAFIGTAPFSGSGAEVRYQQDPTRDMTYVEADLSGDSSPDLYIELYGLQTLSAANFALTPAQSSADLAAGAQLGISTTRVGSGSELFYSNVKGRSYSSFEDLYTNSTNRIASDLNLSSSANELDLGGGQQTNTPMKITRASGTETVSASSINFSLAYHSTETIQAGNVGADTFAFRTGFGAETVNGFVASGAQADTIQLATASFSYLTPGMTQAQDLAAVLSHSSSSSAGTTIHDSFGDSLTLAGMTAATIAASHFTFV